MPRLICISDVHGHLKELNCLLEQVELRVDDRLVFVMNPTVNAESLQRFYS